ncbi:MAG: hypothetical protein AAGH19_12215, partial [Pseudomonadota bacterium]
MHTSYQKKTQQEQGAVDLRCRGGDERRHIAPLITSLQDSRWQSTMALLDDLMPDGDRIVIDGQPYWLNRIPSCLLDWSLVYGTPSG